MLAGLDVETTPDALESNDFILHCISVYWEDGVATTYFNTEELIEDVDVDEHTFIIWNAKFDLRVLEQCGLTLPFWEDGLLLSYDYKSAPRVPQGAKNGHSLEAWGLRLGYEKLEHDDFSQYSEQMRQYCERDAEIALRAWQYLVDKVDSVTLDYYYYVEKPFLSVIMMMEANGYLVDSKKLEEARQELSARCETLHQQMQDIVGQWIPSTRVKYKTRHHEKEDAGTHIYLGQWEHTNGETYHWYNKLKPFNPGSTQHKAYVIQEIFGQELPNQTESGTPKTGDAELKLFDDGERSELGQFVSKLREYNDKAKLLNTFVEGMLANQDHDGRVRANYNQAVTRTGRLSSSDPNLQNLPSKGEGGNLIRKSIISEPGKKIVCADVSQFQYRIAVWLLMAELGLEREDVQHLVQIYTEGKAGGDIHEGNRQLLSSYAPNLFESESGRKYAKTFGFALLFGASANKIAETSPLTLEEARTVVEAGNQQISSFDDLKRAYIDRCKRNKGVIRDGYGRRLEYPGILSDDRQEQARNERQVFNATVQATEATVIKLMGILMAKRIHPSARFCGIVHDEFIIEVPDCHVEETEQTIEEILSADWLPSPYPGEMPNIPCEGDAQHADNWKDAKGE